MNLKHAHKGLGHIKYINWIVLLSTFILTLTMLHIGAKLE